LADRFGEYLRARAAEIKPSAICEEAAESWLRFQVTVAETVAAERSIEHVFCEPDAREQKEIFGRARTTWLEDNQAGYPVREKFRLDRMRLEFGHGLPFKMIIFVCGAAHVPTFGAKLKRADIPSMVCCTNLGEDWGLPAL
jgi:hypothetical protein